MPEAARSGDDHTCPSDDPTAHRGGPILAPASENVKTNRGDQARGGDKLKCQGSPVDNLSRNQDFIVTGSSTVTVNGKLAARKNDKTMHRAGPIIVGSGNVEIGGKAAGVTLGNTAAGLLACEAAKNGRNPADGALDPNGQQLKPNTPWQSYNNCGVESARQVINQACPDAGLTQEGLLDQAMNNHNANVGESMWSSGTTSPEQRRNLLNANHVPAEQAGDNTMPYIQQLAAERRGVIVSVWAGKLWPRENLAVANIAAGSDVGAHAVLVTGLEYDENGQLKNVIINDTGTGQCGRSVPADTFERSLIRGRENAPIATKAPVW